jgi:hypothetical protein
MAGVSQPLEGSPHEFEARLALLGYSLNSEVIHDCSHENKRSIIWYQQEDGDGVLLTLPNRETSLKWFKHLCCPECIDNVLESLGCGGHYHNLRFYSKRDDETVEVWSGSGMRTQELDPEATIYDEESDENSDGEPADKRGGELGAEPRSEPANEPGDDGPELVPERVL